MALKPSWSEKLFGKNLIKCSTIKDDDNDYEVITTVNCLINSVEVIGIYFSFANINAQTENTTTHLLSLYQRLNNDCSLKNIEQGDNAVKKVLEIVQVVLWANNDVFGDFEKSHKECIVNMPWLAVPFHETDLKAKLSRRYRIKVGVPTIVLLDSEGSTITVSGQERLVNDPLGDTFPWKPRPVNQVLKDVKLIPGCLYDTEHQVSLKSDMIYEELSADTIRAFYFSAHWCPPCKAFTPQLIETYKYVRKKDSKFEVIFVSSDRSIDSFTSYISQMPWLAIPYHYTNVRTELAELYGVRGIPTLLLVDGNGHVITPDARSDIQDDPKGQNYPWKPGSINILTERFVAKLQDCPAIILFIDEETDIKFGESVLSPAATKYYAKYNIDSTQEEFLYANEHYIQFLIGPDSETSDLVRDLIGLDDLAPLLVAIDISNNRFIVMDSSVEINIENVCDFVEKYQSNQLEFKIINHKD